MPLQLGLVPQHHLVEVLRLRSLLQVLELPVGDLTDVEVARAIQILLLGVLTVIAVTGGLVVDGGLPVDGMTLRRGGLLLIERLRVEWHAHGHVGCELLLELLISHRE